jgi:hypothetical protein
MVEDLIEVGAATHIAQRETNEDHACAGTFAGGAYVVVADGVGGEPWGDVASATACKWAEAYVRVQMNTGERKGVPPNLQHVVERSFKGAQFGLRRQARSSRRQFGMKTTLIVAMVHRGTLAVGHLGDGGAWIQTRPQELPTTLIHPMANTAGELTGVLSPWAWMPPQITLTNWSPGSVLFATTDGLADPIPLPGLAVLGRELLATRGPVQSVLEELLQACSLQADDQGPIFNDNMGIAALRQTLQRNTHESSN